MLDRRELLVAGAAAVPALLGGRWPAAGAAAAVHGVAFVTADAEAHVAVVGLASRRVVRRIATVDGPRSIERSPDGRRAIVAHADAGAITLLDLRDRRVVRVLRGFVTPRYTAFAPGGRLAYVSDGGAGEVAVVDVVAGRVLARVGAGDGARHLGLTPDGRRLWVALGSSAAAIAIVDPHRRRRVGTVRPPFLAHDVAFSPSGRRAWVTAGREPRIAVLSAFTGATLKTLGADAAPQHVAFGPSAAYVASGDGRSVRTHALTDGRVLRRARVPSGSYNIQRTGRRVVTPSLGTGAVTLLDPRGAVIWSAPVARHAHDACLG